MHIDRYLRILYIVERLKPHSSALLRICNLVANWVVAGERLDFLFLVEHCAPSQACSEWLSTIYNLWLVKAPVSLSVSFLCVKILHGWGTTTFIIAHQLRNLIKSLLLAFTPDLHLLHINSLVHSLWSVFDHGDPLLNGLCYALPDGALHLSPLRCLLDASISYDYRLPNFITLRGSGPIAILALEGGASSFGKRLSIVMHKA